MNETIYQKLKKQIDKNLSANEETTFLDAFVGVKPKADREHIQFAEQYITRDCFQRLEKEYDLTFKDSWREFTPDNPIFTNLTIRHKVKSA